MIGEVDVCGLRQRGGLDRDREHRKRSCSTVDGAIWAGGRRRNLAGHQRGRRRAGDPLPTRNAVDNIETSGWQGDGLMTRLLRFANVR
jgi:hypothetical protein